MPRTRAVIALIVATVVAAAALSACVTPPPAGRHVAIYGDSLVNSTGARLNALVAAKLPRDYKILNNSRWGTAGCDWLDQMRTDARADVDVVAIALYGNMGTPCTAGDTRYNRYVADARAAIDIWAATGTRILLIAAPGATGTTPSQRDVAAAYQAVAAEADNVTYIDAGNSFVDPASGTYAAALACNAGEPCLGGLTAVRSPDKVHLCDHGHLRSLTCPANSPGVNRYARPIAAAIGDAVADHNTAPPGP